MPADVLQRLQSEADDGRPVVSASTSIPELNTGDLEPLQGIHTLDDFVPADDLVPDGTPPTAPQSPRFATANDALRYGLSRGGGPFGPREAAVRFVLLPDSRYARQLEPMRQAIHETLSIDLYTATQALQKEIPSYLGSAPDSTLGELLVRPLWELGMRVLMLERELWLEGADVERVVRLHVDDPRHLIFEKEDGGRLAIARGSVRWAALGAVRPDDSAPAVGDSALSDGAAGQLGLQKGSYQLLDLLRRGNRRPIRIRSDQFDFSFLGDELNLSADLNLRRLLSFLTHDPSNRELVIPLDENFRKVPHLPGSPIAGPGGEGAVMNRRELEFTEYVLLLDARHHF